MSFQYPYALLVLLAVPVLILIYILRNRYKETTVSSTYLWELSQKFLKKRNPFHSRENLIALFVQILAISFMAVTLAHPVLSIKGKAQNRVFVLDGSASRNRVRQGDGYDGKETKFEVAKQDILKKVNSAKKGSSFTLIISDSNEPRTICQNIHDTGIFKDYISKAQCSYSANSLNDSISLAQKRLSNGTGSDLYLATDKKVKISDNVHLRSYFNEKQTNYAITNVEFSYENDSENENNIAIVPHYVCYDHDNANFRIRFKINDQELGVTKVQTKSAGVECMGKYAFNYTDTIASVTCEIDEYFAEQEKGYKDCLSLDNSYTFFNEKAERNANVLLVSRTPLYLQAAFKSWGVSCKTISPSSYAATSGYDIYVFDSFTPEILPTDGAVWFVASDTDVPGSGFSHLNTYTDEENGYRCEYSDDNGSLIYKQLTKNLSKKDVLVSSFERYSRDSDSNFTTILSYRNIPRIFAGRNASGQREVVFSFALQKASLAITYDFLPLIRNLVTFSHPSLLNTFSYIVGDSATINAGDDVVSRTRVAPDGKETPVVKGTSQYINFDFDQVGTYVLKSVNNQKVETDINRFVNYPKEEGSPIAEDLTDYQIVNPTMNKVNGIYDSILPVAIATAVFFVADWFLYTREQY